MRVIRTRARALLVSVAFALAGVTPTAEASLVGDAVDIAFKNGPTVLDSGSATVSLLEFSTSLSPNSSGGNRFDIDVESNTIRFSMRNDGGSGAIAFTSPVTFNVSSLGIAGGIVGISIINNGVGDLVASPVSFTADSITLNLQSSRWTSNRSSLLVQLITSASTPSPSLVGDSVNFAFKNGTTVLDSGSATVGLLEFSTSLSPNSSGGNLFDIDVESNTIRISMRNDGGSGAIAFTAPVTVDVSSLDIDGDIVGISVINNDVDDLVANPVSFTADSITLDLELSRWTSNRSSLLVQLVTRASVPEPGTFALLGLGLAGLATRRRYTRQGGWQAKVN